MRSRKPALLAISTLLGLAPFASALAVTAPGLVAATGNHRCEMNRNVLVRQVSPDKQTAVVQWERKDYTLKAIDTRSGALRYEDRASGLTWIVLYNKAMLLDTKQGRQLANDCRV